MYVWGAQAAGLLATAASRRALPCIVLATDAVVSEIESIDTPAFVALRLAKDFHRSIKVLASIVACLYCLNGQLASRRVRGAARCQ
jgi:hypothetical protein